MTNANCLSLSRDAAQLSEYFLYFGFLFQCYSNNQINYFTCWMRGKTWIYQITGVNFLTQTFLIFKLPTQLYGNTYVQIKTGSE